MGEWELGVRCTSPEVHAVLRRALADHLLDAEHPPAPANFSLQVAEDRGIRGAKDFHLLYRGVTAVVRTRDLRRLLDGLLGYLSSVVERVDERLLRLDVAAFVRTDGAAVLVPAEVRSALATVERRLNAKGLRVVDRPWAQVDVRTGELVVPDLQVVVDRPALDELVAAGGKAEDPAVPPGRYPIVGWGFGAGPDERGPISRALAVTLAGARLLDRPSLEPQDALERLAFVVRHVEPTAIWWERPEDLVDAVVSLSGC